MAPQSSAQKRASDRVAAWLAHNEKNQAWLVDETGADPGTIGDFLGGARWPKLGTQGKIERALGWSAGTIRQIGNGADPNDAGAALGPGAAGRRAATKSYDADEVFLEADRQSLRTFSAAQLLRELGLRDREAKERIRELKQQVEVLQVEVEGLPADLAARTTARLSAGDASRAAQDRDAEDTDA